LIDYWLSLSDQEECNQMSALKSCGVSQVLN
jgi:hypothetical protein